ncbi:S49 family peptidase [Rhizobium leucaenae]|uniref:S49 family peptidase n=1 Tax=Rhizobium leucaenae TaxID=29450 RepID=UPI0007EE72BF|nr:S49 family peptidase [Rhizobium leucaenae]
MRYAHIIAALMEERWAIQHEKMQVIIDFMAQQAAGIKFEAAEIEARIGKGQEQAVARKEGNVALLPLQGVISNRMSLMGDISGGTSAEGFGHSFQSAVRDDGIKAIVIDVNSPGGTVSGTPELSSMIYSARGTKPIIAHVNANAASAAYWAVTGADEVVVTPSGQVGSIGVLSIHDDMSAALEKAGIKKTITKAGDFKTDGNPFQPLSEDAQARLQAKVDASYDMFVRDVARNRNVSLATVREGFGRGDMVDAQQAVAEGMADRIGTLEETLQRFGVSLYGAPAQARRRAFAAEREKRALML